jgi:hypothetical protein
MSLLLAACLLSTVGVGDQSQQRHINNLKCLCRWHQRKKMFDSADLTDRITSIRGRACTRKDGACHKSGVVHHRDVPNVL